MSLLSAQNIFKSYQGQPTLKDVSLSLEKGEILAIIGKSGSGKSTLIRTLAGLLDIDNGSIIFNNEALEGPEKRLVPGYEEIRLVHQDFQLKHKMTIRENIRYALLAYIREYQEERINTLLDLCKIAHLQHKDISLVSGGEKQRVAIARAMATEPDILLMDEPFSNLDLNTKYTLLEELKDIASKTETAIILITHDARDAMEIADRVIVLSEGKILREGKPEEIYHDPKHEAVAELVGFYNLLSKSQMARLDISRPAGEQFGLWAEDVVLGEESYSGQVIKTSFGGPYQKVHIDANGILLWAYDFSKQYKSGDEVSFSIRDSRIFPL